MTHRWAAGDAIAGTNWRCRVDAAGGDLRNSGVRIGEEFSDRGQIAAGFRRGVGRPKKTG